MKLNKCFNDVFSAPMKELGFKKYGCLYYRMQGVMLQGVWLKSINPFFIHFSTFPYWLYNQRMPCQDKYLKKGWWTQVGGMMFGFYYEPDAPERNMEYMVQTFNLFRETVLPYFDSMKNEDDYYHALLDESPSKNDLMLKYKHIPSSQENGWVQAGDTFTSEIFLHRLYYHVPQEPVLEILENYYQNRAEEIRQSNHPDTIKNSRLENLQLGHDYYLTKIRETSEADFSIWYKNTCAEMKQMIEEQLKISVEHVIE